MKLFKYIFSGIIGFSLILCTWISDFTVYAAENEVCIDNDYLTYEIKQDNSEKHVYAYDQNGNIECHLIFENNIVYEENDGNLKIIAYIEEYKTQEKMETYAIEPNWGNMLSVRTRVTFPNPESTVASAITGIIIGAWFPGASLAYSTASTITEYIMNYKQNYIDQTCFYREASGCPQYRWYNKYEYRNQSGVLFKTVSINRKSFIGVTHSPENPPACRMYGF